MNQLNLFKWRSHSKNKTPKKTTAEKEKSNSRELDFEGHRVQLLRRAYQRSLRVTVKPNGNIRVTSGKTASINEIQKFLRANESWLKKALGQFKDLRAQYPRKQFIQGEGVLFGGEYHYLNFTPSAKVKKPTFEILAEDLQLVCYIPRSQWSNSYYIAPQPQIKPYLVKFYEQQGREVLAERVHHYSEAMGLIPTAVSFRSQKTRWGSCSPEGSISLNWRLVAAPEEVMDYVVIHELAHLRHHDHSSRFWSLVSKHSTKHKVHRKWLRDHLYEFDFLAKESEIHPLEE